MIKVIMGICLFLPLCHVGAQQRALKVVQIVDNPQLNSIWESVYDAHKRCWIDTLNEISAYEVEIYLHEGDTVVYIKNALFLKPSTLKPTHQFDFKGIRFVVRFLPEPDSALITHFFDALNQVDDWYYKTANYDGGLPGRDDPNWLDVTSIIFEVKLNGSGNMRIDNLVNCMPSSKVNQKGIEVDR